MKHAFPRGKGRVLISVDQVGPEIELTVADDGVGMTDKALSKTPEKRGADYVAIFVRQLGGAIMPVAVSGSGTTIRIRFPSLLVPQVGPEPLAA